MDIKLQILRLIAIILETILAILFLVDVLSFKQLIIGVLIIVGIALFFVFLIIFLSKPTKPIKEE